MRALHFCFLLHHPYELHSADRWDRGYYGGEEGFRVVDEAEYQPLLALLERNAQRYSQLRVSVAVSGVWLEQAERWDASLIKRLRTLVKKGNVELVTLPYYYSAAAFFEMDEFASQVKRMREKLEQTFDYKSEALALPECCYHNKIAKWAEKNGYKVILAGDAAESLDWRDVNRVYLAKGCENVKILFQDAKLTRYLVDATAETTVKVPEKVKIELPESDGVDNFVRDLHEPSTEMRMKTMFSAKVFQKQLDLELLRGDLINIYLSSRIMKWRDRGIVGFFDELFKLWMEVPGRKLVGVKECEKMPVSAEVSVKRTASSLGEATRDYALPNYWQNMELDRQHRLYELREKILETHDKDLYVSFARLTARDYVGGGPEYEAVFEDMRKQAVKFSHDKMADNQPAKKGMTASTKVKINFDRKAREARKKREELLQLFREVNAGEELDVSTWNNIEMDDMEAAIQVMAQRMQQAPDNHHAYDNLAEAEVVTDEVWMEEETTEMDDFDDGAEVDVDEVVEEMEKVGLGDTDKKRRKSNTKRL